MIPHRREFHLKDLVGMTDKQLELMLKRVSPHESCRPLGVIFAPYRYTTMSMCVYTNLITMRVTSAYHSIHPASMHSYMCAQEQLLFESKYCPKQGCGSPQAPYLHRGMKRMRCTKTKCQHITRHLVSTYFHFRGTNHIAVRSLVCSVITSKSIHICTECIHHCINVHILSIICM